MKKILMILIIAFAIIACDDGTKKETPRPQSKTITQANGLAFDGKVTIKTSDLYTSADWNAVVQSVITAFNAAYENATGPSKGRFDSKCSGNGLEIILVNNLANNWEVRDGEFNTLYLKTASIYTANYSNAIQDMAGGTPAVGKATPAKNRVFLALNRVTPTVTGTVFA
jgi:hypothetical protein